MRKINRNKYSAHIIWLLLFFLAMPDSVASQNDEQVNHKIQQDSCMNMAVFGPIIRETAASITTRKGDDLRKNSIYSVSNSLYGMIPGLNVTQRSGEPGSDEANLLIRGLGTFGNDNSPLIIIDGFERDINSLVIEDIESISVLKDATSAVLYGGKAANGVIQITTKRGKAGKTKISIDLVHGYQQPMGLPKFVSSADYAKMYNQALINDGLPTLYSQEDIDAYLSGNSIYHPNVDWMDEMLRKSAPQTRVNATAKGGNEVAQYYASIGYLIQDGIYNHTGNHDGYHTNVKTNNLNFRSNLDIRLVKNWKMQFDIFGTINSKNIPQRNDVVWSTLNRYSSMIPIYVEPGKLGGTPTFPSNPMSVMNEQGHANIQSRYIQTSLSSEYDFSKIVKGLKVGARFAYDNFYTVRDGWTRQVESFYFLPDGSISEPIGKNSTLNYQSPSANNQTLKYNLEGYLDYTFQLNEDNRFSALALYHQDKVTLSSYTPFLSQSISALLNYKLKDRYLLDIGLNYYGVDRFEKGNRFALFPSVSAAWVASNESFLKDSNNLNHLKLHVSVGKTGRSNFSERFAYRELYDWVNDVYFFGTGGSSSATYEAALANPNMTYETSTSYEVGIDGIFFDDLYLSASYFHQKRNNILVSRENTVPAIIGAALHPVNEGKAKRSGIELALSYKKSFEEWGYFLGLNIGKVTSKILFNAELEVPKGSEYNYRTGYPISQPFGLQFIGFFESQEDIDNSPLQQFGEVRPGDMKYRDINGDGLINQYDETSIGETPYPEWEVGFNFSFNYKGFDLSGLIHAQLGRNIYLGNNPMVYWPLINDAKISTYVNNPWTEQINQKANYPRLTTIANPNNYRRSDFWYKKADFLRMRSLECGYTFKLRESKDTPRIRIFFLATNLFTLSDFGYSDPEVYTVGYPAMKTYNLGLNVHF